MARTSLWRVFLCFVPLAVAKMSGVADAQYTGVSLYSLTPPSGYIVPSTLDRFQTSYNGQLGAYSPSSDGSSGHALLYSSSGVLTDLNPTNLTGYSSSRTYAISRTQQVGDAWGTATGSTNVNAVYHATLWSGSSGSTVDLHPATYAFSHAFGLDATHQVGMAAVPDSGGGIYHAMVWNGSAASAVDLNPTKFGSYYFQSWAYGVSGTQQVGQIFGYTGNVGSTPHAVLWDGSAASAVDLQPTGLPQEYNYGSVALATNGTQQVGTASFSLGRSFTHAMLWNGTAASAVDLNPSWASDSFAQATNGAKQVGYAGTPNATSPTGYDNQATVWSGTAASAVNLGALLPTGLSSSIATSINSAGDVFGTAYDHTGVQHAVQWIAAPHTASGGVAGGANGSASVAGRSTDSGDIVVKFASSTGGTLSNTNSLTTVSALASQTTGVNFALPTISGLAQEWDLSFTGTFTGNATVVFHFDPTTLAAGTDLSQLAIEHYANGQWTALPGVVDPIANTITVTTPSFSPFVLAAVPEPSLLGLLAVVGTALRAARRAE